MREKDGCTIMATNVQTDRAELFRLACEDRGLSAAQGLALLVDFVVDGKLGFQAARFTFGRLKLADDDGLGPLPEAAS